MVVRAGRVTESRLSPRKTGDVGHTLYIYNYLEAIVEVWLANEQIRELAVILNERVREIDAEEYR